MRFGTREELDRWFKALPPHQKRLNGKLYNDEKLAFKPSKEIVLPLHLLVEKLKADSHVYYCHDCGQYTGHSPAKGHYGCVCYRDEN